MSGIPNRRQTCKSNVTSIKCDQSYFLRLLVVLHFNGNQSAFANGQYRMMTISLCSHSKNRLTNACVLLNTKAAFHNWQATSEKKLIVFMITKKKNHLQFACPRERLYINRYKLRCYKRISSPEKSRNNTREKKSYFFTCVWYRQSAADTSLTFRATRSGWLVSGKPFAILSPRSFAGIFLGLWLLKHWKIRITYTHTEWCSNFPNTERKTEY